MTKPTEAFYPLPKDGFNPEAWVTAALRGGRTFALDDDDRLVSWEPIDDGDPGPEMTRYRLADELDHHRFLIYPVLRERIERDGVTVDFPVLGEESRHLRYRILAGTPCLEG